MIDSNQTPSLPDVDPRSDRFRCAGRKSNFLAVTLLLFLGLSREGFAAEPPAAAAPTVRTVDRLVIIVHPCPYQIYHKPAPNTPNYPYAEMEKATLARWMKAAELLPPTTFVVQIDMPKTDVGPDQLHAAFVTRLGPERVCRIKGEYQYPEKPAPLVNYYDRIHAQITQQIKRAGLSFDPAHCDTELWGQSFEGCAPGYGTAVCRRLGLTQLFTFAFDNSVPDARFLLDARRWEVVNLPQSDIVAYLFELSDGTTAALFQSRKEDQWLDHRSIELQLDPARSWVSDKQGNTIWPKDKANPAGPAVKVMTSEERFIRSRGEDLKAIVQAARVTPAATR